MKQKNYDKTISIRIPVNSYRVLCELALLSGHKNISTLVRWLIVAYLRDNQDAIG